MDKEKFQTVISYFEDQDIQLPIDVKNSIEDVFMENDIIDSVECYFPDEKDIFLTDLTMLNSIEIDLNGKSSGTVNAVFSYYADIEFSLSESSYITKDGEKIYEIVENIRDDLSTMTSDDWQIVLHEIVSWDTSTSNETTKKTILRIYCPTGVNE